MKNLENRDFSIQGVILKLMLEINLCFSFYYCYTTVSLSNFMFIIMSTLIIYDNIYSLCLWHGIIVQGKMIFVVLFRKYETLCCFVALKEVNSLNVVSYFIRNANVCVFVCV